MSEVRIHGDFETRSAVDLTKTTTAVYASHPTTDIWCLSYAYDDEEPQLWTPFDEYPYELANAVNRGVEFIGHHVYFEWEIWNKILHQRYDFPPLKIENCRCTMSMSYAMGLPGALEKAAAAVGLNMQKDLRGQRIMKKFCKPRKVIEGGCLVCGGSGKGDYVTQTCTACYGTGAYIEWWTDEEQLQELYDYCKQDVRTERELESRIRPLAPKELNLFHLDHKINNRGIHIDVPTVRKAQQTAELLKEKLDARMNELTGGYVSACTNTGPLKDYVVLHGINVPGVAKDVIDGLLERDDLSDHLKEVLKLRQQAGKTSTAKLDSMLRSVSEDNRIRYTMQYHGAGTGRWAGRIIQPHNMPRPKFKHEQIEAGLKFIDDPEMLTLLFGDPMTFISHSLRADICAAPGNVLYCGDFSAIESRKLAWLSNQENKLEVFRGDGKIYEHNAGIIYNKDPADIEDGSDERQVGKVSELALGYEGGIGAFLQMAKTYGVNPDPLYKGLWEAADSERREKAVWGYENWRKNNPSAKITREGGISVELIKLGWRAAAPNTVKYWKTLEDAAMLALQNPGKTYAARLIRFKKSGSFLWCRLPSGRLICYPYAHIGTMVTPWKAEKEGILYKTVDGLSKKWVMTNTYGGKLAENVTQASSRCLLSDAIFRVEENDYPVVFHVHDEVVAEKPKGTGDFDEFMNLLEVVPTWADGLPMKASGWTGERYRK